MRDRKYQFNDLFFHTRLNIMQKIPGVQILIVTTPQVFASGVAKRLGLMAKKAGRSVVGVVENMSYFICDHCDKKHYLYCWKGSVDFRGGGRQPNGASIRGDSIKTGQIAGKELPACINQWNQEKHKRKGVFHGKQSLYVSCMRQQRADSQI